MFVYSTYTTLYSPIRLIICYPSEGFSKVLSLPSNARRYAATSSPLYHRGIPPANRQPAGMIMSYVTDRKLTVICLYDSSQYCF